MTCSEYYANNRPLGAGYDSRGNARSLTELTNIAVSSVSAYNGIYTNSVTPVSGTDFTVYGRLIADAIIGSANYFSALGDVQLPAPLTNYPNSVISVNNVGQLTVSAPSAVFNGIYVPAGGIAESLNSLEGPGDVYTPNSYYYVNGGGTLVRGEIRSTGVDLLTAATPTAARTTLGLGVLAVQNAITFTSLTDTFVYDEGAGPFDIVVVNESQNGLTYLPSSIFAGGVASLSALNDVTITTPTSTQVLTWNGTSWVNSNAAGGSSASALSALNTDVTITTPTLNDLLQYNGSKWVNVTLPSISHNSLGSLTTGNPHTQYVLTATNNTLSSNVTTLTTNLDNHIASASVHFTSGSLSGYYAASSWVDSNYTLQSTFTSHTGDSSIHFTSAAIASNFVAASGGTYNSNYSFGSVSATTLSATNYSGVSLSASLRDVSIAAPSNGQALVWDNSTSRWSGSSIGPYQSQDATLTTIANANTAANVLLYFSGADAIASSLYTPYARTFVSSNDAAAARGNIGLSGAADRFIYFSAANAPAQAVLSTYGKNFIETTYSTNVIPFFNAAGNADSIPNPSDNAVLIFDQFGSTWVKWLPTAGYLEGYVLSLDPNLVPVWAAPTGGGGGGTPGGSEQSVQYKIGSAFTGDSEFTYNQTTNTVSSTNVRFSNASGAIVSATTVSAGTLHVGGSDGIIRNDNGNIFLSATNGQIIFPLGLSSTSAVMPGFTVSGGGVIIDDLVSTSTITGATITATSVSATTYSNLPFNYGRSYLISKSLF